MTDFLYPAFLFYLSADLYNRLKDCVTRYSYIRGHVLNFYIDKNLVFKYHTYLGPAHLCESDVRLQQSNSVPMNVFPFHVTLSTRSPAKITVVNHRFLSC